MDNSGKIILDLCGGTGAWSKPYKDAGYDVRVITLPECDARLFPSKPRSDSARKPSDFASIEEYPKVYGVLAAPVCTMFSGSGAAWKRTDSDMLSALSLVDACLRIIWVLKPTFWALENPVGKLRKWIGSPTMTFQPYEYGDPYTKRTCLWGQFNVPEQRIVKPEPPHITPSGRRYSSIFWKTGGGSARTKELRSITPQGFADAFYKANK